MKIKQELIDNIVSLDLTREELAKQLLMARYTGLKHKAEAEWLDRLADMLRDGEGNEEQKRIYATRQNRLEQDYIERKKRGIFKMPIDSKENTIIEKAKKIENVSKYVTNTKILKSIYLKNKLINFIIIK